jgi:hypothetical protein
VDLALERGDSLMPRYQFRIYETRSLVIEAPSWAEARAFVYEPSDDEWTYGDGDLDWEDVTSMGDSFPAKYNTTEQPADAQWREEIPWYSETSEE